MGEYPVVGKTSETSGPKADGYDFFVGIGNAIIRQRMQKSLVQDGCNVVTLIHPQAVVAYDVTIGVGTVVMAGAVINPGTTIGDACIINTCSSVDHDNNIGDFSHISVGAHTAGTVTLGERCWLGIGAVVSNNISVADDCMIGAGAVVVKDLKEAGTYVGAEIHSSHRNALVFMSVCSNWCNSVPWTIVAMQMGSYCQMKFV